MADDGNSKPKRFDISQMGNFAESDENREKTVEMLRMQYEEMTSGNVLMKAALRDIGGVGALEEATRVANSFQDSMRASALGSMQDQMGVLTGVVAFADQFNAERGAMEEVRKLAFGGLPEGYLDSITGAANAASQLVQDMREQHTLMFQNVDMYTGIGSAFEATNLFDANRPMNIPHVGSALEMLGIDRIGAAFAAADAVKSLGLSPAFNDELRSVASLLAEQVSAFDFEKDAALAALNYGLTDSLESMLTRTIAAQEALLEEHQDTAKDAKVEANFHRRIATISVIINILMFLFAIALQLEERFTDEDAAVHANTEALIEMGSSFDTMASQLESMQATQEATSEQEKAADAEITGILRDIAKSLAEQAETDVVTEVEGIASAP